MDQAAAVEAVSARVATEGVHQRGWKDPRSVATTSWRKGALDSIADSSLGTAGVALVELELSEPHPHFSNIVRVDDRGIWYSDGDGHPDDSTWRLRLIPWHQVDAITLHQVS